MPTTNTNIITAPGTYVSENTAGLIPAELASFNRCYMLGTGATGPYNSPTQVISVEDFTNQFGVSPSLESVRLFFRNHPGGILYFVRVGAPNRADVVIGTAVAGDYSISINGTVVSYTAQATDTQAAIVAGLVNAINNAAITPDVSAIAGTNGLLRIDAQTLGDNLDLDTPTAPGGSSMVYRTYEWTVTLGTPSAGTWSLKVNGVTVSYNATGTPTLTSIVAGLANAVATHPAVRPLVEVESITGTTFRIVATTATMIGVTDLTAPGGSTITAAENTTPRPYGQFIYAIENSFDPELMAQGFLIAPEAFQTLSAQGSRTSVAIAMENQCATEGFDWMALVDSGAHTSINTLARAQTEGLLYTSARGHLAYFYPYLLTIDDAIVPPSAAVAAIALRRYGDQGFNQPPAGAQYPVRGVKDAVVRITKAQQATVNPLGINCVRYFPNQGTLVWGSRTRSSNPYYRFINVRVILNVLIGTLRTAFDSLIFTAIDGQGVLFSRIRETAASICYRMWDGGALFGASPQEAFFVKCDRENNPDLDLEAGVVRLDCYVVPSPTMERLLVSVNRTAIGQVEIVTKNLGV